MYYAATYVLISFKCCGICEKRIGGKWDADSSRLEYYVIYIYIYILDTRKLLWFGVGYTKWGQLERKTRYTILNVLVCS